MILKCLELPYPPSVNHYWRRGRGKGLYISAEGRAYRQAVKAAVGQCAALTGRLGVVVDIQCPDRRRRDIGNLDKALFDSLQYAGLYEDDGQIDFQAFNRLEPEAPGCVYVRLWELVRPDIRSVVCHYGSVLSFPESIGRQYAAILAV
jgi:crossover junction endodeoxyribonuclease RusA